MMSSMTPANCNLHPKLTSTTHQACSPAQIRYRLHCVLSFRVLSFRASRQSLHVGGCGPLHDARRLRAGRAQARFVPDKLEGVTELAKLDTRSFTH